MARHRGSNRAPLPGLRFHRPPPLPAVSSRGLRTSDAIHSDGVATIRRMACSFSALPVGQGDAFLLERSELRLLVDGGKSRHQAGRLLASRLNFPHLDVVICTHNDTDHAEGVLGLLEGQEISVGEVWLPGRWTERLVDLCSDEDRFFEALLGEVEASDHTSLEALAQSLPAEESAPSLPTDGSSRHRDPETTDASTDPADFEDGELIDALDRASPGLRWLWPRYLAQQQRALWMECIEAARRIVAIAVAARDLGCRLRWFDYAGFRTTGTPRGGRPDLMPINSVEISARTRRPQLSPLRYLALSVANRESRVFYSPADDSGPGVLFTADSDLALIPQGLTLGSEDLVTVPHHGSEANANAYAVVERAVGSTNTLTWVRSDGRFRKRPGAAFRSRQKQALCTRCRGYSSAGQHVDLDGAGATWVVRPQVARCQCR